MFLPSVQLWEYPAFVLRLADSDYDGLGYGNIKEYKGMIPKKIHYCWYGGKSLPKLAKKCIKSWKKYCPDYEIIRWDESNTDLQSNQYVREAFSHKKWAFITDYVRLKVLYEEGGIYMDTDVQVISSLDQFLVNKGFSGFENEHQVPTGIMAGEKGNMFIECLLRDYDNKHFVDKDGKIDDTTNVDTITRIAMDKGLVLNNTLQTIEDFTFYPLDFFCPKDVRTLKVKLTDNTATVHHFAGSWVNPISRNINRWIKRILGEKISLAISNTRDKKRNA